LLIAVQSKHLDGFFHFPTKLIDDYDSVLSAIFARLNKEDRAYVIDCKDKEKRGETKAEFQVHLL